MSGGEWFLLSETGRRKQAENNPPTACSGIPFDADETALESPRNSMIALKKRVGRWSYSVICLYPVAEKIARFAPIFDDLACSYKNEGSIPFTRSTDYQALATDCSKSAVK